MSLESLLARRKRIISEIDKINTMKRGTLNEQYLKVAHKNSEPVLKGPYYVFSRSVNGKTTGRRVKIKDVQILKEDIAAHKAFVKLMDEFVEITEQITDIVRFENIDTKKK
ncbi:MAG: hypothetical protein ACD_59C00013G0008 [uncultured bacterium]|nr:MAG: hypothetical protein ACD_59C00013G0008 [uncultured bacterium]HBC74527.1 hypothetical protein [Candidatus Wallbacteria bacterium]